MHDTSMLFPHYRIRFDCGAIGWAEEQTLEPIQYIPDSIMKMVKDVSPDELVKQD